MCDFQKTTFNDEMNLKKYIKELKRRHVFKAGVAYLIIAWLLAQVASIVLPTFNAPSYVMKTLLFILSIGFLLNLVFAWIYDITPDGIKKTENIEVKSRKSIIKSRRLNKVIIVSLSIAVILLLMNLFSSKSKNLSVTDESYIEEALRLSPGPRIAVLPFTNLSNNPEQEYFTNGLTEDIITALSRTDLFVLGSTSSFKYKNNTMNATDIGKELEVHYILKGSVRRDINTIRVAAQLLDINSGSQLWGRTYDRDLNVSNIFEIQDDITVRVVGSVADDHGVISRLKQDQFERKHPEEIDSYECILRSYTFETSHNEEDHLSARNCLENAVKKDSTYADGLAQLAYLYREEYQHNFNQRPNALNRAVTLARKAIDLDGLNQRAYYALALAYFGLREVDEFFIASNRAIELNPNNSHIIGGLGVHIALAGQWEWGIELLEKTLVINPASSLKNWLHYIKASDYYNKGEYNKALAEIKLVELRNLPIRNISIIAILANLGEIDKAEIILQNVLSNNPNFVNDARMELEKFYLGDKDLIDQFIKDLQFVWNGIDSKSIEGGH